MTVRVSALILLALTPMVGSVACSTATATPSERWTLLAAEFKNYDNVQFHVDIQTVPMAENPFFGANSGKIHAVVWLEPAKKRLVFQTGRKRMVFPEGTIHDRRNPPEPIPEPILGLGAGFYHVLTTGFEGCTAEESEGPKGYRRASPRHI